jgi:hypothetical protein
MGNAQYARSFITTRDVRESGTGAVRYARSVVRRADSYVVEFISEPTVTFVYTVVLAVRDVNNWSRGRLFLFSLQIGLGT